MGINEEGAKKALETKRKRYGDKAFSKWGSLGQGNKFGYFAWLKIHDPEKLKMLQDKGRKNRLKKLID